MKKCISLILVLTIILGTITCAGFQSVALNSNAENFDSIAFDGTEYYDSVDTTTPNHGYRLDFPEEGYMVINFTFYAPVHMTFEDVWAEEVLDSLSYTTGWQKASPDNPVTIRYTWSVEPGAQLIRVNNRYGAANGSYAFSVVYTPYGVNEIEDNNIDENSKAKACAIKIGDARVGSFIPGDVFDYYEFTLDKDLRLTTTFVYYLNLNYIRIEKKQGGKIYYYKALSSASFENPSKQNIEVDLPKGTYYFLVAASNDARGKYEFTLSTTKPLIVPTGLKVITRKTDRQTVSWNKAAGASGYQVQCSDGARTWKYTKTGTSLSASFTGLTAGGRYKFRVRSYTVINGVKHYSAWSKTLTSCAKPSTAKITAISSPAKRQIKTSWAKASGVVSGYQIQFSKNKAFTQIVATKTIKTEKTLSYLGKNLTSGTTYYVRVRTYTVFNGYYYGAWSAAKKIKCK